jgi:hypothetical protein
MTHTPETLKAAEHHVEIFRWVPADMEERARTAFLAGYDYRQKEVEFEHCKQPDSCKASLSGKCICLKRDHQKEIDELVEALDKVNRFYKHLNPDLKNGANIQLWHNEIKPEVEQLIQKHKR